MLSAERSPSKIPGSKNPGSKNPGSKNPGDRASLEAVLHVVAEMLESGGYDAVQLREVAARSRTGLGTIYKQFPSRNELIVSALELWMAEHVYAEPLPPIEGESLHDALMRQVHAVFEPWERSPRMLEAFFRARSGPGGDRLTRQGFDEAAPAAHAVLAGLDPRYVDDVQIVMTNVVYGLMARFAAGDLEIVDIVPSLERTITRVTNEDGRAEPAPASAGRERQ